MIEKQGLNFIWRILKLKRIESTLITSMLKWPDQFCGSFYKVTSNHSTKNEIKNNQFLCWISSRTSPYRFIIVSMVSCLDLCVAPVSSLYSTENFGIQWAAVIIQFWWIRVAPHVFPAPPFPKRIIANLRMIIKLAGWISRKFQNSQFLVIVAISEWKPLKYSWKVFEFSVFSEISRNST